MMNFFLEEVYFNENQEKRRFILVRMVRKYGYKKIMNKMQKDIQTFYRRVQIKKYRKFLKILSDDMSWFLILY